MSERVIGEVGMYRVRALANGGVMIGGGRVLLKDLEEVNELAVILADHLEAEDPTVEKRLAFGRKP